jgi:hypothetical protein
MKSGALKLPAALKQQIVRAAPFFPWMGQFSKTLSPSGARLVCV